MSPFYLLCFYLCPAAIWTLASYQVGGKSDLPDLMCHSVFVPVKLMSLKSYE